MTQSHHIFVYDMTAQILWHVDNWNMIGSLNFMQKEN